MGYYIQTPRPKDKAAYLQLAFDAKEITQQEAKALINNEALAPLCVVDNGPFEAVGFMHSAKEFEAFTLPEDPRPKTFLAMDRNRVVTLTNFPSEAPDSIY